ncbi:MAG TPA: endonuclease MutS2, partial [Polyangiaceae bacterium]
MDSEAQEQRTRAALEWDLLLERFAERCASRASAEYARALTPAPTRESAGVRLARTRQALTLADLGHELPAREFPEITELLERVRAHGVGSGSELAGLTRVLELAKELRAFAKSHAESAPEL